MNTRFDPFFLKYPSTSSNSPVSTSFLLIPGTADNSSITLFPFVSVHASTAPTALLRCVRKKNPYGSNAFCVTYDVSSCFGVYSVCRARFITSAHYFRRLVRENFSSPLKEELFCRLASSIFHVKVEPRVLSRSRTR